MQSQRKHLSLHRFCKSKVYMVNVAQLVRASDCGSRRSWVQAPSFTPKSCRKFRQLFFLSVPAPTYRLCIIQLYNSREFFYLFLSFLKEIFCDDMFLSSSAFYICRKRQNHGKRKSNTKGWESSSTNCGMSIIYLHPISLSM